MREAGAMKIEPLHDDFGARVRGVDLTGPLPLEQVEALHAAIDEHSILLFPEQDMSDEAQLSLTQALGDLEENHVTFGRTGEIVHIGTVGSGRFFERSELHNDCSPEQKLVDQNYFTTYKSCIGSIKAYITVFPT